MVKKITDNNFEEVKNSKLAVVDFSATWCGPCQMLAPIFEELSEEMSDVDFYSVDVDANPVLSVVNKIASVPTIHIYVNGEKVEQQSGFQPKESLQERIEIYK